MHAFTVRVWNKKISLYPLLPSPFSSILSRGWLTIIRLYLMFFCNNFTELKSASIKNIILEQQFTDRIDFSNQTNWRALNSISIGQLFEKSRPKYTVSDCVLQGTDCSKNWTIVQTFTGYW